MSAFPDDVVARLVALACRGVFEAHLTVEVDPKHREPFVALCDQLGVKCVLIELARGAHRDQPMTSSHHRGALPEVLDEIARLHARITAAGFAIVRVKLEADAAMAALPADGYWEFHTRLATDGVDLAALATVCGAAGAHLSRNAREGGAGTRFATLRVSGKLDRAHARARSDELVDTLAGAGYVVVGTEAEFTLYDSRVALDAGWLDG